MFPWSPKLHFFSFLKSPTYSDHLVTFWSCDASGTNMDKAADFDTKSLSPHSKGLKPNFKNRRVIWKIDVHISMVAEIAFICFLKSLCSFSPFVTVCHSGHVILAVTGCGLPYSGATHNHNIPHMTRLQQGSCLHSSDYPSPSSSRAH